MYPLIIKMPKYQQSILGIVVVMVSVPCNTGLWLLEEIQFLLNEGFHGDLNENE